MKWIESVSGKLLTVGSRRRRRRSGDDEEGMKVRNWKWFVSNACTRYENIISDISIMK